MNLTDAEIEEARAAGQLVRNGETAQLGPACYELRMGRIYYDLTEGARRFDVGEGGKVLIKPEQEGDALVVHDVAMLDAMSAQPDCILYRIRVGGVRHDLETALPADLEGSVDLVVVSAVGAGAAMR